MMDVSVTFRSYNRVVHIVTVREEKRMVMVKMVLSVLGCFNVSVVTVNINGNGCLG